MLWRSVIHDCHWLVLVDGSVLRAFDALGPDSLTVCCLEVGEVLPYRFSRKGVTGRIKPIAERWVRQLEIFLGFDMTSDGTLRWLATRVRRPLRTSQSDRQCGEYRNESHLV
jgi:hypothetical protein